MTRPPTRAERFGAATTYGNGNGNDWDDVASLIHTHADDARIAAGPHEPTTRHHVCTARNCRCRRLGRFDLPEQICATCKTTWPCEYAPTAGEQIGLQDGLHGGDAA